MPTLNRAAQSDQRSKVQFVEAAFIDAEKHGGRRRSMTAHHADSPLDSSVKLIAAKCSDGTETAGHGCLPPAQPFS